MSYGTWQHCGYGGYGGYILHKCRHSCIGGGATEDGATRSTAASMLRRGTPAISLHPFLFFLTIFWSNACCDPFCSAAYNIMGLVRVRTWDWYKIVKSIRFMTILCSFCENNPAYAAGCTSSIVLFFCSSFISSHVQELTCGFADGQFLRLSVL